MKLVKEFLIRIKLVFVLFFFYSLILSYYSLELLEFLIEFVSTKIGFDIMLTQIEDLSIVLLDLINYSLLTSSLFIVIIQIHLFFKPSFFSLEKEKIRSILLLFLIGFLITFFSFILFFNNIYELYVYQINFLNSENVSTKIMIDLKKLLSFLFLFFKVVFMIFLPINVFLIIFAENIKTFFLLNSNRIFIFNFCLFAYLFIFGFLETTNILHILLFYLIQLIQLEILYFFHIFVFSDFR